jgi:DNA repair exonuclease SbcCD ATPase subunit
MPPVSSSDAPRASLTCVPYEDHADDDTLELGDFEAELQRLSAANQELMDEFQAPVDDVPPAVVDDSELVRLQRENAELRSFIEELEAAPPCADEQQWLERQREYEMLLEEKSEVIRSLHLKMQEMQESAIGGEAAPVSTVTASGTRLGQAEEILRLKRELESQRRQLEQDEQDMMNQMRQMEMTLAKERAEMARQRQEVTRLQADLNREIENASRDPELRERLHTLRRQGEARPSSGSTPVVPTNPKDQKTSGFLRRMFG